jgi:hypothetical protein
MLLMLHVAARQPSSKDVSPRKTKNTVDKTAPLARSPFVLLVPQNQNNPTTHFPVFLLRKCYAEQ